MLMDHYQLRPKSTILYTMVPQRVGSVQLD